MKEQPAFEIWSPTTGKHLKIYASGRVDGLYGWSSEDSMVCVNRIPQMIAKAALKSDDFETLAP